MKPYGKDRKDAASRRLPGQQRPCPCCVPKAGHRKDATRDAKKHARHEAETEATEEAMSDSCPHCPQITPNFTTILNEACPYCNDTGLRCVSKPTPPEVIPPISEWINGSITIQCSYVYVTCVCRGGAPPEKLLNSPHRETRVELLLTPEGILCISVAEPGYKLRSITPNVGDSWEVVFKDGRPWFRQVSNEPELYPLVQSIKLNG